MNENFRKSGNRAIHPALRIGVGFLLPVCGLFAFSVFNNNHRPRVGGPEGGFEQLGYGIASLTVVGVIVLLDLILASCPFRTMPALLAATLIPAIIGAAIIASIS